jgi:hypothetical protein
LRQPCGAAELVNSKFDTLFPRRVLVIFPHLSYGPSAWSLLRLKNPAIFPKTVKVDVYRGNGERLSINSMYTLGPGETVDIRIDGHMVSNDESSWAKVEDVSTPRSKPSLQASAREEQLNGDTLDDFPQTVARAASAGRWVSPAAEVRSRNVFFLNVSDQSTVLNICSTDAAQWRSCSSSESGGFPVTVNPRQSVVLTIGRVRKRYLLI